MLHTPTPHNKAAQAVLTKVSTTNRIVVLHKHPTNTHADQEGKQSALCPSGAMQEK